MASSANLLLAVLLALSVAVGVRAYLNRPARGSTTLTAFMLTVVVWQGSHLLGHFASGGLNSAFERLEWLGIGSAAFVWLLFVLEYTGSEERVTRRTTAAVLAWPALLNGLVWVAAVVELPAVWPALNESTGVLFWTHALLSYAVFGTGSLLLIRFFWRARAAFRKQGLAVAVGVSTLWVGSLVSLFELLGDLHFHATTVGLTATGLAFLWATTRGRLTDLVPVATSTVLETVQAGVVVVDRDDRVVELNPVATELLDLRDPDAVVGDPLAEVLDDDGLHAELAALGDGEAATVELDDRSLQVRASALQDGGASGRVYLLDDITEQKRRQERLQRQNERLDAFAGVVSHDLRNPLMVARGFVDETLETGDLDNLESVQDAHERIDELVEDLLTLAREGDTVDDPVPVELGAVASDAWRTVETPAVELQVADDRTLRADRSQLERLLENLFRNAVEHGSTSSRPEADVAVEHGRPAGMDGRADGDGHTAGDDDAALTVTVGKLEDGFYVADDGVGIPAEDRDRVLESGFSTGEDGAGLGLAIVEGVADAHGWEVGVTESDDGGARFEFTGVEAADATGV